MELKRLNFQDNKEDILYTLGRLNPKYLIGLYIKTRRTAQRSVSEIMNDEGLDYDTAKAKAYTQTGCAVVYDGVTFIVSYKTLKEEFNRRVEIGQILVDSAATTLKTRWTVNKKFNK